MKIARKMSVKETLKLHPDVVKVYDKYKMNCVSCMGSEADSVERAARMHGVDVEALLRDLNELFSD
ncbi:MAG: DUF1858 domain-containing protein [bacterium]